MRFKIQKIPKQINNKESFDNKVLNLRCSWPKLFANENANCDGDGDGECAAKCCSNNVANARLLLLLLVNFTVIYARKPTRAQTHIN